MKTRFIVNLHSGRAARILADVRAFAARRGDGVVLTERPRHASELAAQAAAEGCDLVVAVGGDGTMNEVATALTGTDAILGLVPCGSGDGLALHLGIARRIDHALSVLAGGQPRLIDTGTVNGFPFFNAVGLGFEAAIAGGFARLTRRGLTGYVRVGFSLFFSHQAEPLEIEHDEGRIRLSAFSLGVQNSPQLGNHAISAPGARVDDGLFDLVAIPPIRLPGALALVGRLALGTFERAPGVVRLRSARFVIERQAPGSIHTDGEPRNAAARLEVSVRPQSLRVMVPAAERPVRDSTA